MECPSNLNILSLNVRGLRDFTKRSNLFYWLKQKKFDFCLLQETYWTNEMSSKLQKEWEGDMFLSFGSHHSRGTAILLKDKHTVLGVHKSEDSRIILINIKIEDQILTIINIYAPNNVNERKGFFSKLQKWVEKFSLNENAIIIGGDFNHTDVSRLDRHKPTDVKDTSSVTYKNLTTSKDLHDIWRQMHPSKKQYTYKDISRLDKFLVTTELLESVQKTHILIPGIKTDHKGVTIFLDFNKTNRGPGRWKMNTSILNDKAYIGKIKSLLQKTQNEYKNLPKQLIWEMCKIRIKAYTIDYCKQKRKVEKNLIENLEKKIQIKEEELINSNYNRNVQFQRDVLTQDLHKLIADKNKGAYVRSRAKWIEEGEKSTKFFFNLEKQNISKNTIKKLKRNDGSYTMNDADIIEEGRNFYKDLYTKESIPSDEINKYLNEVNKLNKLSENQASSLEGLVTKQECESALKIMKNNKSPGSDGIPVEFYKAFWDDINLLLIDSLNSAYDTGELSGTQKRGILSLLFKKNDKHMLKNWRPISLLNTDYKILAHVLANRLKSVIGKLIHTDQNGYIKGRNIAYNIRLIQDVINYFENDNIEGAIVFLDFQKAFDTVNHDFLLSVLEKFNFGSSFIKWVKTIYTKSESCLSNNGWTSRPFEVQRGIRQGCPLSALLFLLVVEILGDRIRQNTHDGLEIKFKTEKKYIQVTQLADDTTVFLKNEQAITNCLEIIQNFGNVSGLKLNIEKTEGLWLGRGRNRGDGFANINWEKDSIKALGVVFGYNNQEIEEINWRNKIDIIRKLLNKWNYRDLSLQGRILIVKTLALSQVVYLLSSICVPNWAINEINKEFFSFVWKYKRDKICRKVLINEIEMGGLKMIDFKSFCLAAKAVWCQRLINRSNETWTIIPQKYMEGCSLALLMRLNIDKDKQIPIHIPKFYKEAIFSWHSCSGGLKAPQSEAEIRKQIIWGNKMIQTKGKTLFFKTWHKSNINFIDDLLDQSGNLKKGSDIFEQLEGQNRTNWLIEYNIILKSIPSSWKTLLTNADMKTKIKKDLKPFIYTGNKYIFELPSKIKEYYTMLVNKIKGKSFIEKYWNNVFPNKPTWHDIWSSRIQMQSDKKLADFHYKILHKIVPSQENLYKWKLTHSNTCRFGCQIVETYNHMFLTCPRLSSLNGRIERILNKIGFNMRLSYRLLLFGHKVIYPAYKPLNDVLSYIFFAIYKHWLHNDRRTDVEIWVHSHLSMRMKIFKEINNTKCYKLVENILLEWDS